MTEDPTLGAPVAGHARARPDAVAVIDGERAVSWRELEHRVGAAAAWLAAHEVRAGDRVAVWMDNRIEWLAVFLGLARLGAAAVAVNTRYRADEVTYLLSRAKATLLVTQARPGASDFMSVLASLDSAALPSLRTIARVGGDAASPVRLLGRPVVAFEPAMDTLADRGSPDALAILFTTSGTTRGPKLVMHTQRTLALHSMRVAPAHGLDAVDARLLAALPLAGTFGMTTVLAALRVGTPIVLHDVFDAPRALAAIDRHAVTHVYGSDEMVRRLLDAATGERPMPTLRLFGFAAFRADAAAVAREAVARGLPMRGLYGSSEVHALFALQPGDAAVDARLQAGGRPAAGERAEVRVRDADSGALLAAGEVGDLEIRADTNFVGYLDDADATAAAVDADGWFRTGDVGSLRGDGSFVYETRRGDAMRLGGFLVNPGDIEAALRAAPGVADVQVVPVDIDGRHRCAAFVIARDGAAPVAADVLDFARASIAPFKVPARVWFVDAFPIAQSANGNKVQRARLRAMALERLARGE